MDILRLAMAAGPPEPEDHSRHANPYPPGPLQPPRWFLRWWPVITAITSWSLCLILIAADLLEDWEVGVGAMPVYAALLAVGGAAVPLGRRGSR